MSIRAGADPRRHDAGGRTRHRATPGTSGQNSPAAWFALTLAMAAVALTYVLHRPFLSILVIVGGLLFATWARSATGLARAARIAGFLLLGGLVVQYAVWATMLVRWFAGG